MDVLRPFLFCLYPLNNFVLSDVKSHTIRVFSPEGNLLHSIGRVGHQNRRLVCVSEIFIRVNFKNTQLFTDTQL